MATIAVLGTFDTKGEEHRYVAEQIRRRGHATLLVDVGTLEAPRVTPDVPRSEVAAAAGVDLAGIVARRDRGEAVAAMARGAPEVVGRLQREGRIDGVISLGGGGGTAICTAAMRALPVGFPKLMVSTLASGNTAPYVGVKDIVMMPSVVDVAGLNRLSRRLLAQAAGAICGMVEARVPEGTGDRPVIVASQFGNTTACVTRAREVLEAAGYEVMIFAATGNGGRTMESLVESGMVAGVLDITTTEWADEWVGGVLRAGPTRCEAAARHGVPAIITPGCLDMVNFGEAASVPEKFRDRRFYPHNPQVTLMRTNPEEARELGRILAGKCNLSTGPVSVLIPLGGISVISAPGQPFHWPEADEALFSSWKQHLRPGIPVIEYPGNINDPDFAELCARELLRNIARARGG
ncbi:MAG: Tm-1-like ATP-binding domain-containing protein [Verrucomicrobiota bacterium]